MQETDHPRKPLPRLFIDKLYALCRKRIKLLIDIVHLNADMMNAFALLFKEFRDSTLRIDRFYELDIGIANTNGCRFNPLVRDILYVIRLQTEDVVKDTQRLISAIDRYSNVINTLDHLFPPFLPFCLIRCN